jgi:hypothetical protein
MKTKGKMKVGWLCELAKRWRSIFVLITTHWPEIAQKVQMIALEKRKLRLAPRDLCIESHHARCRRDQKMQKMKRADKGDWNI